MSEAVRRVGRVVGRQPTYIRLPLWAHYGFARVFELVMKTPLVARAQVRILSEGVVAPGPLAEPPPEDLVPRTHFSEKQIKRGLPEARSFGRRDLRWFS